MDLELELNLTGVSAITRLDAHNEQKHTHWVCLCVCKREDCPVSFLVSAGQSVVHTMPLIPVPVHLSCSCFLSAWAKTFYLNLPRVPLKGLCYCSEPSCVCVTWESQAQTHLYMYSHTYTHIRFCLVEMEDFGWAYLWRLSLCCSHTAKPYWLNMSIFLAVHLNTHWSSTHTSIICIFCVCVCVCFLSKEIRL